MNKIIIAAMLFLMVFGVQIRAQAYSESYSYNDYGSNGFNNGEYCSQATGSGKQSILTKIRNAFIGQMTGYTPQIPPSPYLNPYYGPSYNQGFYTGNQWNSHNVYNPVYPARLFGTSF